MKRLADWLSQQLGYKVFRTTEIRPLRKALCYGAGVDKLAQYQWFKEKQLPALEYTQSVGTATNWIQEGSVVFGRKLLNSSCGKGIVVYSTVNELSVECPVYTKYKKKKREWRVHVFRDKVVSIVEKKKRSDWTGPSNSKIRNLENGYVFCQEFELSSSLKERIEQLALKASGVCASDFKGVDLAYNEANDDLFIIEVNSAPGIEGTNVEKYGKAVLECVQ
jgi:glutathione synthase/RimK-type ligase-like ATP-grasp enzyme